ncbi:double-CXXCG motif protein (plasmid) [Sorangium sp. So ce119]|uniref:double-CXXCG motif protein n=1 Tax=Sorangium sp. So ce119 TaxID=3133279 RepID=UPI003F644B1F
MQFFKLTHPEYQSDQEDNSRNPVISTAVYRIPGISCNLCGPWSSSDRLRIPLPSKADEFLGVRFLPLRDWKLARDEWANLLHASPDDLTPGVELGPPMGTCTAAIQEDAVHPIPGQVWIGSRVRDALVAAGLSGVSFAHVDLPADCGEVEMWELVVHGRAWRRGSTGDSIRLCEVCGRRGFPSPKDLSVDETRWDGSDFVLLDHNPNIIVVTDRVAKVINASFSNLVAIPVG